MFGNEVASLVACLCMVAVPLLIFAFAMLNRELQNLDTEVKALGTRLQRLEWEQRPPGAAPARPTAPSQTVWTPPAPTPAAPAASTADAIHTLNQRKQAASQRADQDEREAQHRNEQAQEPTQAEEVPLIADGVQSAPVDIAPPAEAASHTSSSGSATPPPHSPKAPARRRTSLEESLSTKIYVWIGGVALVVAGGLFLRHAFVSGWISPAMRLIICAVGGLGLIAGSFPAFKRAVHVGQAMAGAGIATLFGVVLFATHRYEFIGPFAAFAFMAAITAGAIILSLRFGQFVALLGLIGGFATPSLIGSTDLAPSLLFTYLALLQVGLVTVTYRRDWHGLSACTLLGALIWAALRISQGYDPVTHGWLMAYITLTMVTFIVGSLRQRSDDDGAIARHAMSMAAGVIGLILFVPLIVNARYSLLEFSMFGLVVAGCMVLARADLRFILLPPIAVGLVTMTLLSQLAAYAQSHSHGLPPHFMLLTIVFGCLFAGGSYLCVWKCAAARWWSVMAAVCGVTYLLLARIAPIAVAGTMVDSTAGPETAVLLPWWVTGALVAAAYVAMAAPLYRLRSAEYADRAIDALAAAACACAALTLVFAFELPNTLAGFAVLAAVLVVANGRLRIVAVRWSAAIAAAVAAPLLIVAVPFAVEVAGRPVLNELLLVYGLSTAGFVIAAWRHQQPARQVETALYELAAIVTALAGATLIVRHGFHGNAMLSAMPTLVEGGTLATVWLVFAFAAHLLGRRFPTTLLHRAGNVLQIAAVIASGFVLLLLVNPMFRDAALSERIILNAMLYSYGLPMALMVAMYWLVRGRVPAEVAGVLGFGAMALLFVHVNLEVRHAFHPHAMGSAVPVLTEGGTLATAWLLLAGGVHLLSRRLPATLLNQVANVLLVASVAGSGIMLLLLVNPLFRDRGVGDLIVFNWLLLGYGLPTLVMFGLYGLVAGRVPRGVVQTLAVGTLVLLFAHLNLEVRHYFHAGDMSSGNVDEAEWYCYSVAWILFACLLAAIGIARRQAPLRWASLGVMLLAIAKVFLFDSSNLEGLYRVLSFLGLGVSLLVVGFIYQRLVFPTLRDKADEPVVAGRDPTDT